MRLSREKKGDRESWLVHHPASLPPSTIVILEISQESYQFAEVREGWREVLEGQRCPACGSARLGHHSSYQKYLYGQRIAILRLRCRGCGRTHAVIPSWSLPNTSVGTAEVERYLMARERGASRPVALAELRGLGMHAGYGKQLERRLGVIVSRGKALWPQAADLQLGGLAWVRAACAPRPGGTPLLSLNHFSLERRVNAICCSRSSILLFGRRPGRALKRPSAPDSGRRVVSPSSSPPPGGRHDPRTTRAP